MNEIWNVLELILEGLLGSINSIVGTFLATEIFEIPLLIFLAFLDFIFSIMAAILGDE
jgi:hypothetical protein